MALTPEVFRDLERDIADTGKAVNVDAEINPRYGLPFKSLPMVSRLFEAMIAAGYLRIDDLQSAIDIAAAAGAGANGWTADLVVDGDKTQKQINRALTDGYAYIEFFGDTTTDATNAINMCLLYCKTYNKTAKGIPNKIYPVSGKVAIFTNCDFSQSTFSYPSTYNTVAVEIKPQVGATDLLRGITVKLPRITCNKVNGVEPVAGSVGVKLEAIRDSSVHYDDIQGFETNLLIYSNDGNKYTAYNSFYFMGLVVGSKINIHMLVEGTGWINECGWFGGHFAEYSQDRAVYAAKNIKITKASSGGNNPPNGHSFMRMSLEGAFSRTIDYDLHPTIVISYYSCNTFLNCRFEQATEMRFSKYALYDLFINCHGLGTINYIDGVEPNIIGSPRMTNMQIDLAAIPGSTGFRTSKATHLFQVGNSNSALAIATGFSNRINGGILSKGAYVLFDAVAPEKEHPIIKIDNVGGLPTISMGSGSEEPASKLYYYGTQWRHNFDLCPDTDGGGNIGASALRYNNLFAKKGDFSAGIGLFGATPPTTKRSITGKKIPTTIAEQNAVIDSIVSALTTYGLVSDDRT